MPRICSTYWFSLATVLMWTHLSVMFILALLSCSLMLFVCFVRQIRILSQPSHHCVMTEAWFQSQTSQGLWWAHWHWDRLFSKYQYKSTEATSSCLIHLMSMLCDFSNRWHDEIKHFCLSVWTVQVI